MKPQLFVYKPVFVEAVPVTEDNMAEVAAWCGGELTKTSRFKDSEEVPCIKVDVIRPINARQTLAFVGDRVIKLDRGAGFKVYTNKAFKGTFDPATDDASDQPNPVAVSNAS